MRVLGLDDLPPQQDEFEPDLFDDDDDDDDYWGDDDDEDYWDDEAA